MSRLSYKEEGSLLRPLRALSFLGRPAVTLPLEPRPAAEGYRGFHLNDHKQCIGCSSCQKICDNAAITMVEVPDAPVDPLNGVRNLRPAIDYGRCCWCALCVDICPTGSLNLSREYVHTCTQEQIDSYFMLPDEDGMHGLHYEKGWQRSEASDLLALERLPMGERPVEERIDNFSEIVAGFTPQQAVEEASRCVQCGLCHDACPTGMDVPEYIRAIYEGELEQAVRWIYQTNPFSHVCGRVCTHRCEDACAVGHRGTPLAIRWLKRYAMDQLPHQRILEITREQKPTHSSGKSVAVVGAGPAGLTAAWDLAQMGHQVVVYEARAKPGGMPRYGIPEYRLPYESLDRDIEVITSMGVEVRCGVEVGASVTMDQLRQEYNAVVLAIGLHLGRSTRIPGSDHLQVRKAVELLRRVTEEGSIEVSEEVVVIGGGNVAMDIARTIARLQRQQWGEVRVIVTALEDLQNFLADPDEIREAVEEGVV
ncbi:MAG: FAD-dependent oxidoreductase, partial [Gammaproteobacteria bacterium]|nr:FAD-dependent oxidoreductase [Gammaproteobacteria bacterium]